MRRHPFYGLALAAALAACGGGGDDDGDDGDTPGDDDVELPTDPPTATTMVATGGFTNPMDAVASPDGATFYFTAFTDDPTPQAGIFAVPAAGGEVTSLTAGPPLENPSGLLLSADGSTLFVSDLGVRAGEPGDDAEASGQSVLYTIGTSGGALTALPASGIAEAAGLALGPDEETLYVSGFTTDGQPALFTLPAAGGTASVVLAGAPLESPGGVFVDTDSVAWVMDNTPSRAGGVLWAIDGAGEASEVVSNLGLSQPAGVSLVAGGGTAVIPNLTDDGEGQLLTVHIASGEQTIVASPMKDPAGIRTAREAGVFAVVDSEGGAIYRAE